MLITRWDLPSFTRRLANPGVSTKGDAFPSVLKETRCSRFKEYCWGYPFNWVWRGGVIKQQTPLITTTPYVYEAFLQVYQIFATVLSE